jgi:hypothetical protein
MKTVKIILLTLLMSGIVACSDTDENKGNTEAMQSLRITGDSISSMAQSTFMQQVMQAMQQGGTEYAIDFCHLKASSITDSLSVAYKVSIYRLSDKNRNSENYLHTEQDKIIFAQFQHASDNNETVSDTIISENNEYIYYKPIRIGMPACLKCHGKDSVEIDPGVLKSIQAKYPDDNARNYEMQALRGIWKIIFVQ